MAQIGLSSLESIRNDPEAALVDNLTLFHAQPLFHEIPMEEKRFTPRVISALAADPTACAFLAFLESVVLLERCFVDPFTLQASSGCQEIQKVFSEICKPVTIEPARRDSIYDRLSGLPSNKNFRELLEQERRLSLQPAARETKDGFATFVDHYYDPSDRFKREAIANGAYDPLNAIRSQFYLELAKISGVPYMPHPWREKLLGFAARRTAVPIAIGVSNLVFAAINDFHQEVLETIHKVETIVVPPIAAAILRRAKEPRYVAEAAIEMRGSRHARAFRKWCSEFTLESDTGDVAAVQKKWLAVKEAAAKWKVDLDEEVRYRKRSLKFGLGISAARADTEFTSIRDPILLTDRRFRPLLLLNDVFRVR